MRRRTGSRCRAHQCPEIDLEGERVLCCMHWDLLPLTYREQLYDAFGTVWWSRVLSICIIELRRIEGTQRERA